MGGYNSGRQGWRGVIEQRKRMDIREWRRKDWLAPGTGGTISWSHGGTVGFAATQDEVRLSYTVTDDDGERRDVRVSIPIRRTPCRYGGERAYWLCPNCYKRREVVVMANTGLFWGCRTCLRLRYISQGLAPEHRLQRRADQLYERAGVEYDDGMIYKHKRMRWRTFNRLMDQAGAVRERSETAWAYRMGRLFSRLGLKPEDVS